MKRPLLLLALLCTLSLWGHQNEKASSFSFKNDSIPMKKSELKINTFEILVSPGIGINYEKIINNHSSFGVYAFVNFDDEYSPYRYENFELAPYYRQYFGNYRDSFGDGFFTELFVALTGVEETDYYDIVYPNGTFDSRTSTSNSTGFAMGASIGYKWVNSSEFIYEIFLGAGRYLTSSIGEEAFPRIGFMIGKRF